jgi:hypothetical protein
MEGGREGLTTNLVGVIKGMNSGSIRINREKARVQGRPVIWYAD